MSAPPELADAVARIDQAKHNLAEFTQEMDRFFYRYIGGMIKGGDGAGTYTLQLRHPRDSIVDGRPKVLVAQIVENVRTALDYLVFELSSWNTDDFNERSPQFVIADSKQAFRRLAERRLQYLTDAQVDFIERLQPFNGNWLLALLRDLAGSGKHRRLLRIEDRCSFDITLANLSQKDKYAGHFVYPMDDHAAIFAKARDDVILLMDKYDAIIALKELISHAETVLRLSAPLFQGRPVRVSLVQAGPR